MMPFAPVGGPYAAPPPTRADVLSNTAAIGVGVAASVWGLFIGSRIDSPTLIQKGMVASFALAFMGLPAFVLTKLGVHALASTVLDGPGGGPLTQSPASSAPGVRARAARWGQTLSRVVQSAWGSATAGFNTVKEAARSHAHPALDETVVLSDDDAQALYQQQRGVPSKWMETALFRDDHENPEPVEMKDGILRLRGCYLRVERSRRLPRDEQPAVIVEVGYVKNNAPNPKRKPGADFDTVIHLKRNPLVPGNSAPLTLDVGVFNEHSVPSQHGPYQWRLQST